ncbi:MAG: LysM peptidoglycan-binding domain-containing protein, partial [Acidobacteriia bacterium]|nr:LysM peptidoglycan-binding domain-containing protein [Terriglobia bacterium]
DEGLAAGSWLTIPTPQRRLRYYRSSGGGAGGFLEPGTGRYRIARGDTLGGISQRFGTSIANLRNWNGLSSTRIIAGRYLIVKPEGVGANAASASSRPPLNSRMYRIASGDSLGTIARRFGVSVAQLKAWNGLSSNRIRAGDRLIVGEKPTPRQATSSRSTQTASSRSTGGSAAGPSEGGQYRIRRGDNLATIASRFGVTVEDLKRWNGLRSSRIREGKYLIVRPRSRTTASNSAASKSTSRTVANPISGSGERYRIRRGDNLALIARRFGVSVNDLKAWNGLRGTRITAGEYLIVSPERRNAASEAPVRAAARKEAATSARASTPTVHTIRRGDSLGAIAQRYGVTASELRRWNGIRGSRITAGDTLKVYPAVNFPGTERTVSASKRISTSAPPNGVYTIRRGDNLGDIAERFDVSVRNLQRWNGLNGTRITAGQTLIVSGTAAAKNGGGTTALEAPGKSRYRIRRGDTLAVIAKRFGVSVDDLKRWNGLRTTRIREGHYLTVSPGAKDGDGS